MDNLALSEIEKSHIEFLYKLVFFYEDFHKKINANKSIKLSEGVGYIVNPKLIEAFKQIYKYDKIKQYFKKGDKINDIINTFPKHLIQEIKQQNKAILKNEDLFNISFQKHDKNELKYFTNCTILDSSLISYLQKDMYIYNTLQKIKVSYMIALIK